MANEYDEIMREPVESPNTDPSYDDIARVLNQSKVSNVKASLYSSRDRDPVKVAESVNLSRQVGLPSDLVERKFDEVKKSVILHNDYDRIVNETPGLAKWLQNPDKAAVGKNELEPLAQIDKASREIVKKSGLRQALETGVVGLESSAYALGGLMGLTSLDEAAEKMAEANRRQRLLADNKPTFAKEFDKVMEKESGDVNKALDAMFDAWYETRNKNIFSIFKTIKEGALTIGESIDLLATAVSMPRGLGYMTAESAAFSIPSLVGGALGAVAGSPTGPIGAIGGMVTGTFAGSVLTETGAWMNEALTKRGYDITDAESIRQAFSDRTLLREMRQEATRKGVTTAAVDALFSAFGGKIAKGTAKSLTGKAGRVAADVGVQMVGESVSEGAGQFAATGEVDVGGSLLEGIASLGQSAGQTAIGASVRTGQSVTGMVKDAYRSRYSKDPIVATKEFVTDTTDALETMQAAESLQGIANAVEQAENTKKVPGYIKELVDAATEGDEAQAVYFQADDFDDYFSRKGLSPAKAAMDISEEVARSYDEAKENGTPVEIPLGDFVEKVASSREIFDEMIDIVKVKPDGMTLAQAQEHLQNIQQTMSELADEALAMEQERTKQSNESDEKSLSEFTRSFEKQLMDTGMSQKDAKAVAQLERSRLETRARIRGQSVQEVIAEQPLSVILSDGMGRDEALNQEYRGQHTSPGPDGDVKNRLDDLTDTLPDIYDVDENTALRYYGFHDKKEDAKVIKIIKEMRNNPEAEVTIYRAVPKGVSKINSGDWVSLTKYYADLHGQSRFDGNYDVIEQKVKAKELYNAGDIQEWGYHTEAGRDSLILKQSAPPTYSKVEQLITEKMGGSATPDQIKGMLRDMKPEELKWLGIDEFLKGKKKITKEEMLEHIRANMVEIVDVTKVESVQPHITSEDFELVEVYSSNSDDDVEGLVSTYDMIVPDNLQDYIEYVTINEFEDGMYEVNFNGNVIGSYRSLDAAAAAIENRVAGEGVIFGDEEGESSAKFSQYVLPGGENYREVLFTLPESDKNEVFKIRKNENGSWDVYDSVNGDVVGNYSEYVAAQEADRLNANIDKNNYLSPHWDEKNVLAHVRLNDRVDADGKKVLFVEEIQSDWHQEGRKKGYKGDFPDVNDEIARLESEMKLLADQYNQMALDNPDRKPLVEKYKELQKQQSQLENSDYKSSRAVPDAPFRKSWHEYAMKRIIRMAAEGGYDKVAWTTGEQQAERYDLSNQIDEVEVRDGEGGGYYVAARRDGQVVISQNNIKDEAALSDVIGKELAAKAVADMKKKRKVTYSGVDLKVGGEGMKGFYDNILVKFTNKFIKKYGGKVEKAGVVVDRESSVTEEVHSFEITPQLRDEALNVGFSLFQEGGKGPRGQFQRTSSADLITLFKGRKNPSTIIHELGHRWRFEVEDDLRYINSLPELNEVQQKFKDDVSKILEFLDAKDIGNLTVEQEEKFARAIEAYMLEGKAPSQELQPVFSRVKVWMLSVYRSVKNFFRQNNVELNPNIREVFDRLFVAETEVQEAQLEMNYEAPFEDARAAGMSEDQARRYQEAREKARAAAEEILSARLIADWKKQEQKVYKERRKIVESQVRDQVNNTRVYKALDSLKSGTLEGGGTMKLDRALLVQMYDENFVKNRLKNLRIYTRDGGINPELAASMLGYESADQMIQEIVNAPKKDDSIKAITDQRMREEYPDLMYEPDLPAEALKVIHNDKQEQVYRLELEFFLDQEKPSTKDVVRAITRKIPSKKTVKAEAQRVIGQKKINEVKPYIYRRAEANYNREAGIQFAKGNFDAAFEAKRKALLNYEMFNVAVEATDSFRKNKALFNKFKQTNEKLSKTRDINFIEAGRAILASYGLYRNDGSKPSDFLNDMKRYDPQAYETVSAIMDSIANKGNSDWKTMTYDQYKDMVEGVKALWDLSKEARTIEIEGKKMDLKEAASELLSGFAEHKKKIDTREFIEKHGTWDKAKMRFLGFRAAMTRVEHWTNMMDLGDKINGPFRKYIFQPIADGATQYRLKKFSTLQKVLSILDTLQNDMSNASEIIAHELRSSVGTTDGIPRAYKFSFNELIGMILHTGNESNKRKLLLGRGWGTLDQDGNLVSTNFDQFLNRMYQEGVIRKEHMDAVQQIWDLMEELKPDAQKAHKQMYGYYFNEITANEVVTPFGTYRGGYVPAKADPMVVLDAEKRALVEQLEKESGNFAFPATTGRGSTFSRVEQYNVPLIMDLRLITNHVDWVLRFSYIEPKIKQVSRLLNDKDVFAELNAFDSQALKEMLLPFMKRAASQTLTEINDIADKTVGRVLNYVRTNTGAGLMFFNVGNFLEQVFSSIPQAMTQVKGKYIMRSMMDYATDHKAMAEFVNDKSEFMQTRGKKSIHLVNERLNELLNDPNKFEQLRDFAKANAYILQGGAQNVMDIFIWKAAYEQALADMGATEAQAVRYADSIIRETQTSFNPEDAAAIEAGGPMRRAFMMFYSYFNTMGNLVATQMAAVAKDVGLKQGAGRMFWIYMMGIAMPAFMSQAVKKLLMGRLDEDDDDEYLDDLFGMFFMGQFQSLLATVPWAGQFTNNVISQFNDKPYDDRLSLSPVVSTLESVARTPMHAYKALSEEHQVNKRQATRDFLTLVTMLSGIPAMPLSRPINYLMDYSEGNARPTGPVDFTRGLISGQRGD